MSSRLRATLLPCAALCALLASRAPAAGYTWQISASRAEAETGDTLDADNTALAATRYFTPVDDERGPRAVAAFLSRSSHLAIGGFNNDQRRQTTFSTILGVQDLFVLTDTLDGYSLGGRYVWRDSGWYAGGGLDRADGEQRFNTTPRDSSELRGFRAVAGKYLGASTSLELTLRTAETTTEETISGVCVLLQCIAEIEATTEEIALSAFHVGEVAGMTYSLGGGMTSSDVDLEFRFAPPPPPSPSSLPFRIAGASAVPLPSLTDAPFSEYSTYSVGGELFPVDRFGVRLGYVRWHDDPLRDDGYDVAATWFFLPRVAARFSFERTVRPALDSSLRNIDTVAMELLGRF